jgi:hypothetical protein
MKITDYMIATAGSADGLRVEVLARAVDGWEVYGGPMLLQKPVQFSQALVKKFDLHAGEVWIKAFGLPGRWEKVG